MWLFVIVYQFLSLKLLKENNSLEKILKTFCLPFHRAAGMGKTQESLYWNQNPIY